jgi:hypothetical protein
MAGERPGRMFVMCSPAGFERFVLDQAPIAELPSPPDIERLMTLAEPHGIEIHGPLPDAPESLVGKGRIGEEFVSDCSWFVD